MKGLSIKGWLPSVRPSRAQEFAGARQGGRQLLMGESRTASTGGQNRCRGPIENGHQSASGLAVISE